MLLSVTLCLLLAPHLPPHVQLASFGVGDTLFLVVMALIVFGPKKLPEISRQIGKLLYEFRKASNDFKFQIEEELRASEQAERQKQLTAQAAAPQAATPVAISATETVSTAVNDTVHVSENTDTGTVVGTATEAAGPVLQTPASGLPVSSRVPNRVTESISGIAEESVTSGLTIDTPAITSSAEALDAMQADAQEAIRSAAADPSYHQQASNDPEAAETVPSQTVPTQPVPTHHG